MDLEEEVLALHKKHTGVLSIHSDLPVLNGHDLSKAYTPGVAALSKLIEKDHDLAREYTISGKLVAVVTDGSAVLGLGDIGSQAGLPIVEGKALLYKTFSKVDAVPLAMEQVSIDEFVATIKNMANSFAGIHLEDIQAPRCFEIEEKLQQQLDIPVYHDDQEGTAIVVLAGLLNAAKVVGKPIERLKVVINGIGASGVATAKLLAFAGIKSITLVDQQGVLKEGDKTLNPYQATLVQQLTCSTEGNSLAEAIVMQDVFIGLSVGSVLSKEMVETMNEDPIVFALANPVPEITPDLAKEAGVRVMATGSSAYPNQINNILAFPGLFKGLLEAKGKKVDEALEYQVAKALADMVKQPTAEKFIPGVFEPDVVENVKHAVINFFKK